MNILHALDSQVLCTLLECIHDRRAADITVYSRRYGTMRTHTVYPAKIYVSTQDGRQYLLCYHYRYRKPMFFRLDTVHEVTDERNALERVMLHFSHLEKEAVRVDEMHYRLAIRYNHEDETEILIRILSFGSVVRVLPPSPLIAQLRERLQKQQLLACPAVSVSS